MSKFFIQNNQVNENAKTINLIGEDVNHISKVLRYEVGDKLNICTSDGINYLCEISILERENIICKILEEIKVNTESNINIHIFQGIPKGDKFEFIIEKCTELGVKQFTPVSMSRCIVKIDKKEENKKIARWQKIAESAAKQSGRDIVPKINNIKAIKELSDIIETYDLFIAPYECEGKNSLKAIIRNDKGVITYIYGRRGTCVQSDTHRHCCNNRARRWI